MSDIEVITLSDSEDSVVCLDSVMLPSDTSSDGEDDSVMFPRTLRIRQREVLTPPQESYRKLLKGLTKLLQ